MNIVINTQNLKKAEALSRKEPLSELIKTFPVFKKVAKGNKADGFEMELTQMRSK